MSDNNERYEFEEELAIARAARALFDDLRAHGIGDMVSQLVTARYIDNEFDAIEEWEATREAELGDLRISAEDTATPLCVLCSESNRSNCGRPSDCLRYVEKFEPCDACSDSSIYCEDPKECSLVNPEQEEC